jgi:hypothetical protein
MIRLHVVIFFMYLLFCIISCKSPVVMVAAETNFKNKDCDYIYFTDTLKFNNIEVFKSKYKREISKQARRCNCDTVYIDINDVSDGKKQAPRNLWGFCKERK